MHVPGWSRSGISGLGLSLMSAQIKMTAAGVTTNTDHGPLRCRRPGMSPSSLPSTPLTPSPQLTFYGAYHSNRINVLVHVVCVPILLWSFRPTPRIHNTDPPPGHSRSWPRISPSPTSSPQSIIPLMIISVLTSTGPPYMPRSISPITLSWNPLLQCVNSPTSLTHSHLFTVTLHTTTDSFASVRDRLCPWLRSPRLGRWASRRFLDRSIPWPRPRRKARTRGSRQSNRRYAHHLIPPRSLHLFAL